MGVFRAEGVADLELIEGLVATDGRRGADQMGHGAGEVFSERIAAHDRDERRLGTVVVEAIFGESVLFGISGP